MKAGRIDRTQANYLGLDIKLPMIALQQLDQFSSDFEARIPSTCWSTPLSSDRLAIPKWNTGCFSRNSTGVNGHDPAATMGQEFLQDVEVGNESRCGTRA